MYSISTICGGPGWTQIKQQGFNAVRLAVSWNSLEPSARQLDASALSKLDGAITNAKAAGLYVILDGIHANSGPNIPAWITSGADDVDKVAQEGSWYWNELAKRYKGDDNVIAYDLVNEPHQNVDDNNRLLTMYQGLISTVRAVDGNKIIIIEANSGDHIWNNTNWGILTDKTNLVVSHHSYWGGGDDDGYSSSGWPVSVNQLWSGTADYTPTATSAADIAAHFDKMLNMLATPRLPLFLGEYGIYRDGSHARQFILDNVGALNARSIPRTAWEGNSGGSFSLCRQDSNTWVNFIDAFAW
jgi:aryl-phospho-beta-D-glucosidase BglC (GH1 family)